MGRLAPLIALFLASRALTQPLGDPARRAVESGEWPGVVREINAGAASQPLTGASAYWMGVAQGEVGNTKDATACLSALWAARPGDKSVAIALLTYAGTGWLTDQPNLAFPAALIDAEVGEALVRARVRVLRAYLEAEGEGPRAWRAAVADALVEAFDLYALAVPTPDAELRRWAGFALLYTGDFARAAALLSQAAADLPPSWDLELDLAVALLRSGYPDEAEARYARAQFLAPRQGVDNRGGPSRASAAAIGYARALEDEGRFDRAVLVYRDLLTRQPGMMGARHLLGLSAYRAGDLPLALWAFTDSADLDGAVESVAWLGRAWYEAGDYPGAAACLRRAVDAITGEERKVPADIEHDLGRALWGAQERDEALTRLATAFNARPSDVPRARWYFQAALAADDRYAAIEVCRRIGLLGEVAAARAGLDEVLRRWPAPVLADLARKKPMSHVGTAAWARADICYRDGRFQEAVEALRGGRGLAGSRTHSNAAWMLLLAGDAPAAQRAAKDAVALYQDDYWTDFNRLAMGAALLAQGQNAEALAPLSAMTGTKNARLRDVALFAAGLAAGKVDPALADPYNALGVLESALLGDGAGLRVLWLLPSSPLRRSAVPILPMDRVVAIEGLGPLGSEVALAKLRAGALPPGPATITFVRGGDRLQSVVDFTEAAKALADAKGPPR